MRDRISHRSRIVCESLCPFLYQTHTLRRYITLQRGNPRWTVSEDGKTSLPQDPPRRIHYFDDSSRSSSSQQTQDEKGTRSVNTPNFNLPGSTVTPAERAAFRRLISKFGSTSNLIDYGLRPPKGTAFGISHMNESTDQSTITALLSENVDTEVTNILSLFAPETPEMKLEREDAHAVTDTKPKSKRDSGPYPIWRIRDAALNTLKTISESLYRALQSSTNPTREYSQNPRPADLAVWQIVESQVFAQMTALRSISNPSGATGTSLPISEYQRTTLEDVQMLKTTPPCLKSLDPQIPLLPLLTILYPASTLLAIRTYLRHLPTSPCALAIMPQVKSMGPVSYLLTSNLHFFNTLIHIYWSIYSDFAKVKDVVEEMRQNNVAPSTGTAALFETIRRERNRDLGLEPGEANEQTEKSEDTKLVRSDQWWRMQRQGQDSEDFLKRINSDRRYARLKNAQVESV